MQRRRRVFVEGGIYHFYNRFARGVVSDPAKYRWSGHRELIGRAEGSLVAVDDVLSIFATPLRASVRSAGS